MLGQRGNTHERYSFTNHNKISYLTTVVWVPDHRKSGGFIRVGNVHLAESFTVVEDVKVLPMLHMLRPKYPSFNRWSITGGTSFKDDPRARHPGWMLHLDHHAVQMPFHPDSPSWLLNITSQPPPTVYLWHNSELMPGILRMPISRGEETGEIAGAWLEPLLERGERPLMVASPTSFETGIVVLKGYGIPYFQSTMELATPLSFVGPLPVAPPLPIAAPVDRPIGVQAMDGGELKGKREDDGGGTPVIESNTLSRSES